MMETAYLKTGPKMIGQVKNFPALNDFSDNDLRSFLRMCKIRKYEKNEAICEEGKVDKWLYFLIQGKLKVVKAGQQIAIIDKKGEIFGEMGLFDSSPRAASIKAMTSTACLAADIDLMEKLEGIEKVAFGYVVYRALASSLAERLKTANEIIVSEPEKSSWGKLKKKFF